MEKWILSTILFLTTLSAFGAKTTLPTSTVPQVRFEKEFRFIELKSKKEISDKKNSPLKKYTLAVLTAREFHLLGKDKKALEFYKIANEIKVDVDKTEVKEALKKNFIDENEFFFKADINKLIKSKQFEKAILAINPQGIDSNQDLRITYDLLNVRIKRFSVKKLYCFDHFGKDIEGTNYNDILCDFLNEYLKVGKKEKQQVAYVEDYFLHYDFNKRYLLDIIHDL